ncbi:hypothetical protein DdX_21485 [Ditylenchus destructor]|uniref:Uncharacterized protein n=1 Tax=Ditylenchus destructor TaxID=166010 RepID=A0AAD4MFN5_9BILA|nr:hypothetical protein DdX_21485 [Ditylenchus destructor]
MTNAQVTAGAAALLVEYDAMEAKVFGFRTVADQGAAAHVAGRRKPRADARRVARHRAARLQRAGFLISEMLWGATGNTASDCLGSSPTPVALPQLGRARPMTRLNQFHRISLRANPGAPATYTTAEQGAHA